MRAWLSRSDFTSVMISSLSFLYLRSCAGDSDVVLQVELDVLVLQAAQPLEGVGDVVEGLDHFRLELGLDRGERQRILHVVFVEIALGGGLGRILRLLAVGGGSPGALNGVAAGGAAGGATGCTTCRCGAPGTGVRRRRLAATGLPSGPMITGTCICLASGPA